MKHFMKEKGLGILFALVAGIGWGFSGTVGQYLMTHKQLDPGWITVLRLICSGLILLIISIVKNRRVEDQIRIWKNKKDAAHLLLFGIGGLMAIQFTYMQAIHYSNAGTATALQYSGEILVLAYTCFTLKRKPKLIETLGLILALGGILLLATHGNIHNMVLSTKGLTWGILSAFGLAAYTVIPGELTKKYSSLTITSYGMLIGGVALFFLLRFWTMNMKLDNNTIIGMCLIILIGTAFSFSLFIESIRLIGPLKAGLIASFETVAAPFFSKVWLGTKFIWFDYIGFFCILVMVLLLAVPELIPKGKHD